MKIFAYDKPRVERIETQDFSVTISLFESAEHAAWDDVGPDQADFIMVPFIFKAVVPDIFGQQVLHGGDIMLPFITWDEEGQSLRVRDDLRVAIVEAFLSAFPFFDRYPEKHVFVDHGDVDRPCMGLRDSILFKVNPSARDSAVLPLPQPVPDPGPPRPIDGARFDVSFQGDVGTHPVRRTLAHWSKRQTGLQVEFRTMETSFFLMDEDRQAEATRSNFDLMLDSRFVLSPRGRGTTSRRFFEILAHGRIPIVVSDALKLPLEHLLPYDRFLVRIPEGFVRHTSGYVHEFMLRHDLPEASRCARQAYLDYFAPGQFRKLIELSLASRAG